MISQLFQQQLQQHQPRRCHTQVILVQFNILHHRGHDKGKGLPVEEVQRVSNEHAYEDGDPVVAISSGAHDSSCVACIWVREKQVHCLYCGQTNKKSSVYCGTPVLWHLQEGGRQRVEFIHAAKSDLSRWCLYWSNWRSPDCVVTTYCTLSKSYFACFSSMSKCQCPSLVCLELTRVPDPLHRAAVLHVQYPTRYRWHLETTIRTTEHTWRRYTRQLSIIAW